MQKIDLAYCMKLPPARAIAYFKSKGYQVTDDWHDLWQEAHAKAFTVAKASKLDVLQDIGNAVQKALVEGRTAQWFEKELTPVLQKKGWWGRVTNPETGEEEQLGSAHRLQTIYQTNLQSAYNAGRYEAQMENVDDRPYWMYVAIMDGNTRQEHALLNGVVYPADDPFWQVWYPPNGWGCRCRVVALSKSEVERRGILIRSSSGRMGEKLETISQKTGEMREVATLRTPDPNTGRMKVISPDAGFSYNPGHAWKPDLNRYDGKLGDLAKKELS